MKTKNYLDWISELDSKLGIKSISADVVAVSLANDSLVNDIKELANREVQRSESCKSQCLFRARRLLIFYDQLTRHYCESADPAHESLSDYLSRGNTVLTKTMEIFMATRGSAFLEASVGPVIHRLCSEKVAIDVDGARTGRSAKYIERNIDLLVHWCQEFWKSISEARDSCPESAPFPVFCSHALVDIQPGTCGQYLPTYAGLSRPDTMSARIGYQTCRGKGCPLLSSFDSLCPPSCIRIITVSGQVCRSHFDPS